jgi:hypothetical protein
MKTLFLTGVAVLSVLSASAAHPESVPPEKYDCPDYTEVTRQVVVGKRFYLRQETDATYGFLYFLCQPLRIPTKPNPRYSLGQ